MKTTQFAKAKVVNEILNRGFSVRKNKRGDFLINERLIINIKGCDCDKKAHSKKNSVGGWDKIDPNRFNYFIGVSFKNDGNDVRYFIFSKNECKKFRNNFWTNNFSLGLKALNLIKNDDSSNIKIKLSEDKWNKII